MAPRPRDRLARHFGRLRLAQGARGQRADHITQRHVPRHEQRQTHVSGQERRADLRGDLASHQSQAQRQPHDE